MYSDKDFDRAYRIVHTHVDADMDYDEMFNLLVDCDIPEDVAESVCLDMGRVPG